MPDYLFRSGLRIVKPYYYVHQTSVKGRWYGRTVLQVFTEEFRDFTGEHYEQRIKNGEISVVRKNKGQEPVTYDREALMSLALKNGDRIVHREHKHERPVRDSPVTVVHQDDDLLVVDKPSGIPVHPVQGYMYNSVTEILKEQLHLSELHLCHRLDKPTSGVLLLCKSTPAASYYQTLIQDHHFKKEYLARVDGKFPETAVCNDDVVVFDPKKRSHDGITTRTASTSFQRVGYDPISDQSVVLCHPLTGRRHQIRIHLRNMGHPITNDPLYNGRLNSVTGALPAASGTVEEAFALATGQNDRQREAMRTGETCPECGMDLYKDPDAGSLEIYLHALRYSGVDRDGQPQTFEVPPPKWAIL